MTVATVHSLTLSGSWSESSRGMCPHPVWLESDARFRVGCLRLVATRSPAMPRVPGDPLTKNLATTPMNDLRPPVATMEKTATNPGMTHGLLDDITRPTNEASVVKSPKRSLERSLSGRTSMTSAPDTIICMMTKEGLSPAGQVTG